MRTAANPRPKCLDESPQPTCVCNTGFIRNPKTGQCERLSTFGESSQLLNDLLKVLLSFQRKGVAETRRSATVGQSAPGSASMRPGVTSVRQSV